MEMILVKPGNDDVECALASLQGATQRLLMVLQYKSDHNYERAISAVEHAVANYRSVRI